MTVFVAGGSGALGRPLLRALRGGQREVFALTRRRERRSLLESLGAQPVLGDALDPRGLSRAVAAVRPTHVVHLLTALPPEGPMRPGDLQATNRLRVEGTANLLRAAVDAGARRLLAESFMGVYGPGDLDRPAEEDSPLPPAPERGPMRDAVQAMRALERQLREARDDGRIETVALRYGLVYGPEVPSTLALARRLRRRQVFVPRMAPGVASFIHVDDAATATVAALEADSPAPAYNVVDDEPIRVVEYLSLAAEIFGAAPPRGAPLWLLRLLAPVLAAGLQARLPLSNARARRDLGWAPAHPSLRNGLRSVAESIASGS